MLGTHTAFSLTELILKVGMLQNMHSCLQLKRKKITIPPPTNQNSPHLLLHTHSHRTVKDWSDRLPKSTAIPHNKPAHPSQLGEPLTAPPRVCAALPDGRRRLRLCRPLGLAEQHQKAARWLAGAGRCCYDSVARASAVSRPCRKHVMNYGCLIFSKRPHL